MNKKTIELSLELARNIYKGDNEELKKLVLENFTKEELENEQKKWSDFGKVYGYYIDGRNRCDIKQMDRPFKPVDTNRDVRPTKELAEAALALSQLCQWRDKVNDGWIPDWTRYTDKYIIHSYEQKVEYGSCYFESKVMCFNSQEIRDQFMKDHKDLLEIAKPLL